jgi:2'-5' RNA ligase
MKRVFVGIPILEELQREILEWKEKYKNYITPQPPLILRGGVRWIEPKNLHVTLVPPWPSSAWQVESNKLSAFAKATADEKVIKFAPFEISFDKITFGPNQREPRIIWAEGQAGEEIKKLKKLIEIALGGDVDVSLGRAFYQHLTLARFWAEDFDRFPIKSLNEKVDWRQTVKSFVLYESHLSPQGADYEVLEDFELTNR